MALCTGSLADLVRTVRSKQHGGGARGLSLVDVVNIGLMLCSALDAVHKRVRCLHLDISPGNVLLLPASAAAEQFSRSQKFRKAEVYSVRLTDFGFSRRLPRGRLKVAEVPGEPLLPSVIAVAKGTPGYAPREQLLGSAQQRTDVYSLGATLLFAATGDDPYSGMSENDKVESTKSGATPQYTRASCHGPADIQLRLKCASGSFVTSLPISQRLHKPMMMHACMPVRVCM